MLQPGSGGEEVKTRRDKYPPAPSKAATRYTVAVFPFRGLQHQRTKMHLSNKWMHSCVRATATRRDNDEIPRLIERSAVNRGANPTYVEKMDRCCDSLGETLLERYRWNDIRVFYERLPRAIRFNDAFLILRFT